MLSKTGIPILAQICSKFPSESVLIHPKAIIECYEEIPCNPCTTSCPTKAITINGNMNHCPEIDFSKCVGCGICVFSCPGLAIMIVEVKDNKAIFKIPYEMLPLPQKGEVWDAINRQGQIIGPALIEKVSHSPAHNKTRLIQVQVDKALLYDFITIKEKTYE